MSYAEPLQSLCRSSEFLFAGDHGFNAIVHVLDKLDLGATQSSLVGYVVSVV